MNIEEELKEAKKTLKEEEYKLRWGGYVHPDMFIHTIIFVQHNIRLQDIGETKWRN